MKFASLAFAFLASNAQCQYIPAIIPRISGDYKTGLPAALHVLNVLPIVRDSILNLKRMPSLKADNQLKNLLEAIQVIERTNPAMSYILLVDISTLKLTYDEVEPSIPPLLWTIAEACPSLGRFQFAVERRYTTNLDQSEEHYDQSYSLNYVMV